MKALKLKAMEAQVDMVSDTQVLSSSFVSGINFTDDDYAGIANNWVEIEEDEFVIEVTVENELKDINQKINNSQYYDDWNNNESEW